MGAEAARRLRIGFYSPFFGSTYGGGEKYLGVAAEAVRDAFPEHSVEILSPVPADVERYQAMLGLDLHGISFRAANPKPSAAKRFFSRAMRLRRQRALAVSAQVAPMTRDYDLLLHMVYVFPAFTRARRSVLLVQFPYPPVTGIRPRGLFSRGLRRALFGGEFHDFDRVVCQSEYVRHWVERLWHRDAIVVHPPIDVPDAEPELAAKEKLIVSVGRFFTGGHSKRHDVMVEAFRRLVDEGHDGWELHLAGALHDDPDDRAYFARVEERARGYPVHIHTDAPRELVQGLYRRASVYWHAAGYGADAETGPAELEHFGMTTAEAMAYGAVPVVIGRGGQPEVVEDGVSGYLWVEIEQLVARTAELMADAGLRLRMGAAARERSRRFSRAEFRRRFTEVVRPLVDELEAEATKRGWR